MPTFPVYGFTLPLVDQLSSLVLFRLPYSIWIGIGLIIKGVVIGKRDYNWVPFGPNGMSLPLETYVIDIPSTVIGFMSLLIGLTVLLVRNR